MLNRSLIYLLVNILFSLFLLNTERINCLEMADALTDKLTQPNLSGMD